MLLITKQVLLYCGLLLLTGAQDSAQSGQPLLIVRLYERTGAAREQIERLVGRLSMAKYVLVEGR
jgi:hypothetical protein